MAVCDIKANYSEVTDFLEGKWEKVPTKEKSYS